jgi:predicted metal-binding protein
LPFLEINLNDIIFDQKVQTYCVNPNFQCPSYGHSWACPPEAPYLQKKISKYKRFFLIFIKFNLINYLHKKKANHPPRTENSIKNTLYMKNLLRDNLEQEMLLFLEHQHIPYKNKLILWDGFCRLCSNEEDKGCTYDFGDLCRYPDKIRYSMEAVGIDVTKTVKNLKFNIEWPPKEFVYRFGLVCFK